MLITIESTDCITFLSTRLGGDEIPARLWEGTTDSGIAVQVLVTRIAVKSFEDTTQFEAELRQVRPPSADSDVFPRRLIL
jgi:hypothetical protein